MSTNRARKTTARRVGDSNPTGIRTFDNTRLAQLPEYLAASDAIDKLVHAMQRAGVEISQAEWLDALVDLAAALPYADMCQSRACRAADDTPAPPPIAAVVDARGWLKGAYRCPRCGAVWTCGYAVTAPDYMP
ncbi:hypothetical protein [Pseudonocardia adelaidensis]|uniref:Uncharacterized protein n=1 Tax=Pseudonocardia adelaidensis TaxID=648754 RepID=A0ABP9NRB2_9PSEU